MPLNLTRSILVILIPGSVAIAPWIIIVLQTWPSLAQAYDASPMLVNGVLFGIAVISGTIFDNLGTRREIHWDKEREEEYDVDENWYTYLSRVVEHEPVGYRYISRLVTRMYFELSMRSATFIFALGSGALVFFMGTHLNVLAALLLVLAGMMMSIYFEVEAKRTHEVLCRARKEVNKRMGTAA